MSGQAAGSAPVRVAVVGLGWAARHIWLPRLRDHPGFLVAALVDPDPAAWAAATAVAGGAALADAGTLAAGDVDLAVVAVPNHLHAAVAGRLLAAGVPVFLEKPVCLTAAEADRLAQAERAGGAVLLAGSAARYRSDVRALARLADTVGPIRHVELAWVRARGVPQEAGWFTDRRRAGGGAFVDLGWHLLDIAFMLLGADAVRSVLGTVSADFLHDGTWGAAWRGARPAGAAAGSADVEDTAHVFLVTEGGTGVSLRTSWASHQARDITRISVEGRAGTARLECTFGFSPNRLPRSALTVLRRGEEELVSLPAEPVGGEYLRQLDALPALLADPGMRGRAVSEAHRAVEVIGQLYRAARVPRVTDGAAGGRRTVREPGARPAGPDRPDSSPAPIAAPADVQRLRSGLAAAARDDNFVLHARLPASAGRPGAAGPGIAATVRLARLDAVLLLYSSSRSVVTLLDLDDASQPDPAGSYRNRAQLARLIRDGSDADDHDEVISIHRRMAMLRLPAAASPAVVAELARAVGFMQAWEADVQSIGRTLRTSTYLAGGPLPLAGYPEVIQPDGPAGAGFATFAHAVTLDGEAPAAAAGTVNPVMVSLHRAAGPAPLARLCAHLDPDRAHGRLLIVIGSAVIADPGDLAGLVRALRQAGHEPAWIFACPTSAAGLDQLRTVIDVLSWHQFRLAGVSLAITGRHLEHAARIAQMVADLTPPRALAGLHPCPVPRPGPIPDKTRGA